MHCIRRQPSPGRALDVRENAIECKNRHKIVMVLGAIELLGEVATN